MILNDGFTFANLYGFLNYVINLLKKMVGKFTKYLAILKGCDHFQNVNKIEKEFNNILSTLYVNYLYHILNIS